MEMGDPTPGAKCVLVEQAVTPVRCMHVTGRRLGEGRRGNEGAWRRSLMWTLFRLELESPLPS